MSVCLFFELTLTAGVDLEVEGGKFVKVITKQATSIVPDLPKRGAVDEVDLKPVDVVSPFNSFIRDLR